MQRLTQLNLAMRTRSTVTRILSIVLLLALGVPSAVFAADLPRVVVWGSNAYGERDVPAGLTDVTALAAGACYSLALKGDGTVVAWGTGNGMSDFPAELSDPTKAHVTAISSHYAHNLALKTDGTVVAWGRGRYDDEPATVPAVLTDPATARVIAIAAGGIHSLALREDRTVVEWLADVEWWGVAGLSDVIAISANSQYYCDRMALKANGTVVAWGDGNNYYGQRNVPAGLMGVTAIAIGDQHALAFGVLPLDTTPPTVGSVTATPSVLWPANNKLVNVTVVASITDDDSGVASATLFTDDEYNEFDGSVGMTRLDPAADLWTVTVALRAARNGNDRNGRSYLLTVQATDEAGNTSTSSVIQVLVPHDQRNPKK
jgi:hypothetical protein